MTVPAFVPGTDPCLNPSSTVYSFVSLSQVAASRPLNPAQPVLLDLLFVHASDGITIDDTDHVPGEVGIHDSGRVSACGNSIRSESQPGEHVSSHEETCVLQGWRCLASAILYGSVVGAANMAQTQGFGSPDECRAYTEEAHVNCLYAYIEMQKRKLAQIEKAIHRQTGIMKQRQEWVNQQAAAPQEFPQTVTDRRQLLNLDIRLWHQAMRMPDMGIAAYPMAIRPIGPASACHSIHG